MAGAAPPSKREPANISPVRRAAEYVRMSTEHQKYSTENQSDAIRAYANDRGLEMVRTYADAGLCRTNRVTGGLSLTPDRPIPRPL